MQNSPRKIPSRCTLCEGSEVEFAAADGEGSRRKFKMLAYSGKPVRHFGESMVIDLDGLEIGAQKKPILRQHDADRPAGFSLKIDKADGVNIEGVILTALEAGAEVAIASDGGFPWKASIGINIDRIEELEDGESKKVNGLNFKGPGLVVTKSRLNESSFVPLGADSSTSAVVFADGAGREVEIERRNDMSDKDTNKSEMSAADIDKLKADAVAEAKKAEDERFAKLKAAFPDRAEFVIEQFGKGHDVQEAKAELSDVLTAELAEAKKATAEAEKKTAELSGKQETASDGRPGATVSGRADAKSDDASDAKLSVEELASRDWEAQGFASERGYGSFLREERRQAEMNGKAVTV